MWGPWWIKAGGMLQAGGGYANNHSYFYSTNPLETQGSRYGFIIGGTLDFTLTWLFLEVGAGAWSDFVPSDSFLMPVVRVGFSIPFSLTGGS